MYRIDSCVSSPLIQYMCKSVQSSFDNCSVNTVYSCTLKLKSLGKGLLSLTKYGPISRTAVFLVYRRKRYLLKQSGHCTRISETGKGCRASAPLFICQILPLVTFSYSRGSKNTSLEENIKRSNILVPLFFSV